ncbi:class I SAM-dependent methyltransferase [Streptomyces lonarensis]|uniref:Class I SAM-dependent methyltransferase n=3 Tax=Streptomyces lonarensis TaxID=700599 RepID=A0A7X6CYQ2_9ACTN|nr:class I SAM-dependent methyltransferase [Streptomyces lonarensis]NJQ05012.1 class I SAM-dependent methyltransferase [Streptomyces lonarensis]
MPFDHNDHYHPLLLRRIPQGPGRALDVGCGSGRFALRLAAHGLTVEALDPSAAMIEAARARPAAPRRPDPAPTAPRAPLPAHAPPPPAEPPRVPLTREGAHLPAALAAGPPPVTPPPVFRVGDITREPLRPGQYDVVTALASLHHVPFGPTLARLRGALAPGGVLVVLGCFRETVGTDLLWNAAAVPYNALARAGTRFREGGRPAAPPTPPVAEPTASLPEVRRAVRRELPGAELRRLLLWRYLLVYRAPGRRSGPRPGPWAQAAGRDR